MSAALHVSAPVTSLPGIVFTRGTCRRWTRSRASAQDASRRATCSGVKVMSAAAADAMAVSGRLLPGIGITRDPLASIQASVTCCGLAPTSVATSAKAGKVS